MASINRLKTKLLLQCLVDAKIENQTEMIEILQNPNSIQRIMLDSIAIVMDKELKNLSKRINKKLEHDCSCCSNNLSESEQL